MNKEEYLQALKEIGDWSLFDDSSKESGMCTVRDASREEYELIVKLINEHFDNPPLSFDDLKEGMWVWDSVKQRCLKIKKTTADCLGQRIVTCYSINESIYYPLNFEDNRFFQVQIANRGVEE